MGFLLSGISPTPEAVPMIVNLTTRRALVYRGTIGLGQRLWIRPLDDGGVPMCWGASSKAGCRYNAQDCHFSHKCMKMRTGFVKHMRPMCNLSSLGSSIIGATLAKMANECP